MMFRRILVSIAVVAGVTSAQVCAADEGTVNVLYAGSLVNLMERSVGPAFEKMADAQELDHRIEIAGCTTVGGSCSATVRSVTQITGGIWDKAFTGPFGQIRIGVQYSHTWLDAFAGGGYTPKTSEDMVFTSFRYYPF